MHIAWDDLQTVEALVRTGSIVGAARELSLRHTSVSRRVDGLERSLGTPLFLRGARLRPTPLALSIAERAGEMRSRATDIEALIEEQRRVGEGRLVITTNDVLAPLLFEALREAALDEEHVEVLVSDAERELAPGVADLALRPSYTPGGTLRGQRLGALRLAVFRARGSSGDEGTWILPAPALRARASMRWWSVIPRDAASRVTCDSLLAIRDACVAGLGRSMLPAFLADGDERLVLVQEISKGTPVWLLSPATRRADSRLRRSKAALIAALRSSPGTWV
jgi:DNA-binding transcriptional LysR family regulator